MFKKYKSIVESWECDEINICKYIEMDGCMECPKYEPMNELIKDIKNAKDEWDIRKIINAWRDVWDNA